MGMAMGMSGLQINNKMFVSKQVLDQQVSIMNNSAVPRKLKLTDEYIYRHIGNSDVAMNQMLEFLNVSSIEELMDEVVPDEIRLTPQKRFTHGGKLLKGIDSEILILERMRQFSDNNVVHKSYIG